MASDLEKSRKLTEKNYCTIGTIFESRETRLGSVLASNKLQQLPISTFCRTMSWDSYIDNLIAQSKDAAGNAHVDRACIIGKDGAAWTTTGHANALKVSAEEAKKLATNMAEGGGSFGAEGIRVEGTKYQFLRMDETVALGKKKGEGAITAQMSTTAVVIGHCPEGSQHGNCNKAVGVIADYLISLGM
eukprot:gene5639-6335_t